MKADSKFPGGLLVGETDKNGEKGIVVVAPEGKIRVGGGELVVVSDASKSDKIHKFDGKEMTPCEVVSEINQQNGGIKIPCQIAEESNTTDSKMAVGDVIKKDSGGKISKSAIEEGKKLELEHRDTIKKIKDNPNISVEKVAEMIARDHLNESPDYYKKLKVIEKNMAIGGEIEISNILKTLNNNPIYSEKTLSFLNLAPIINIVIKDYLKYDKTNPIVTVFNESLYFEPSKTHIQREGIEKANIEYATHFVTGKIEGDKIGFDKSKFDALQFLIPVLRSPDVQRLYQKEDKSKNRQSAIIYAKEIYIGDGLCVILVAEVSKESIIRAITFIPKNKCGYIQKQKASNVWSDAPVILPPPIENPPFDKSQNKAAGGSVGPNSNSKYMKENDIQTTYFYGTNNQVVEKLDGNNYDDKKLSEIYLKLQNIKSYGGSMASGGDVHKGDYIQYPAGILGTAIDRVTGECNIEGNQVIHTKEDQYFIEGKDLDVVKKYKKGMDAGGKVTDPDEIQMMWILKKDGSQPFTDQSNISIANELINKGLVEKTNSGYALTKTGEMQLMENGGNISEKSSTTMHNIVPMADQQTNDTQTCKCPTMEYHTKLSQCQEQKLGDKNLSIGTTVKDNKTGVVSDITSIEHRGFKLLPQSSFDNAPRQEFFVSFEEFVEKFEDGLIDVSGYQHTDEDHKLMHVVIKDVIACNIIEELENGYTEAVVVEKSSFAGGGIIGEIRANRKGEIKEVRDVNGKLLKKVYVGEILYNRNSEDRNYRNSKNDLLLKFDATGIHMAYGGIVAVEETPNFYRVDISSPRKVTTCRTPKWAQNAADSVKKGAKVVTCKKYKNWFISSVLVPKDGISGDKAKQIASEIKDKIEHKKMENGGVIYETGAISSKVNNLILFAQTTKNLADMANAVYSTVENRIAKGWKPTIEEIANRFNTFLSKTASQYIREMGNTKDAREEADLNEKEQEEFKMLYALDFPNWLSEKRKGDMPTAVQNVVSEIYGDKYNTGGTIDIDYDKVRAIKYWDGLNPKQRLHFLVDHSEDYFNESLKESMMTPKFEEYKKFSSASWNGLPQQIQHSIEEHVIMGTYECGGSMKRGGKTGTDYSVTVVYQNEGGNEQMKRVVVKDAKNEDDAIDRANAEVKRTRKVMKIVGGDVEKIQTASMENGGEVEMAGYTSTNPDIEQYITGDLDTTKKGILFMIECSDDETEKQNLRNRLEEYNN